MNGYPNSISNSMVNTRIKPEDYNLRISTLPEPRKGYDYRKDMSKKIKTAIIAATIAAATLGGVAYQSYVQEQNAAQDFQVVYSEDIKQYPGFKFEIARNGVGYFVDETGKHYADLGDGMNAQQRANQYVESGYINLPSKTK